MRKGRDHRGEIKGDPIAVEPLVIEQRQISRGGSGGRVGCSFGREIQSETPIKS